MTRATAEQVATVAGSALMAVGLLGFVPDVTTNYGALSFWGQGSRAQLLGVFRVSILLNLFYVLAGFAGLLLARTDRGARVYLVGAGSAFLVLWLLGVFRAGGWIPLDTAGNWLHLALGAGLIGLAYLAAEPADDRRS